MVRALKITRLFLPPCLALGLAAFSLLSGALADDDHDKARRALESHEALPLTELLDKVRPKLGGRIVGMELEREHGIYVYEFKVVTPKGRLKEIYVHAGTGEILSEDEDD